MRLTPLLIGAQHLGLPRKHPAIPCGCSVGANTAMLASMKHEAPAPILEQLRRGHPWCWVVCERCMHRKAVAFAPLIILWRAGGLKRSASAIGAPREVWGEGSCLAAPELGRHGPWVGTVSRVIVAKRLGPLSTEEPPKALCRRRQSESCQERP